MGLVSVVAHCATKMKPKKAAIQRRQLLLLKLRNHINRVWLACQKTVLSGSVETVPHGQGRAVDVLHNCFFLTLYCYILVCFSHPFVETHHTGKIRTTIFSSSPYVVHYCKRKKLHYSISGATSKTRWVSCGTLLIGVHSTKRNQTGLLCNYI